MRRRSFVMGLPLAGLSACAGEYAWAPDVAVARSAYAHSGPKALTLFTMKNAGSDNGAHTGLMVSASQRVIFDPAGTFGHPSIPERNDVHFGITPRVADFYEGYHARETYYLVRHDLQVSPEVAEQALQAVMVSGPVGKASCTRVTSGILRGLPGLRGLPQTWFPDTLEAAFGKLPGVTTTIRRENDSADKAVAAAAFRADP